MKSIRACSSACLGRTSRTSVRYSHHRAGSGRYGLPTQPTETSKDGFRTLRTRRHGNRSLPLPPLMDPKLLEKKEKYHGRKPTKLGDERTQFQKELADNIYARALATDVRTCAFSRARLPSHFLLPIRAAMSSSEACSVEPEITPDFDLRAPALMACTSRAYVFQHESVMRRVDGEPMRHAGVIVSQRMKEWYAGLHTSSVESTKKVRKTAWKWDPNTAEHVLQRLRADVVNSIIKMPPALKKLEGPETAKMEGFSDQIVCLIYATTAGDEVNPSTHEMADPVPVYRLSTLLDKNSLLKVQNHLSNATCLAVLRGKEAVEVPLGIDKLALYLCPGSDDVG